MTNEPVLIKGELTLATVNDYLAQTDIFSAAGETVQIDLSAAERVDSAGVALLLHWLRQLKQQGKPLVLMGASEQLKAMLDVCDLESLFVYQ
ncbi:MAG: STAS domain-containing protein [Arenicella sp.]